MIEILSIVNLWCAPIEHEPEEFFYCRKELLMCVQPDLKKNTVLTPEALKCFERIDLELKKNSQITAMMSRHAKTKI